MALAPSNINSIIVTCLNYFLLLSGPFPYHLSNIKLFFKCGFFKRTRPPPQVKARLRPAERPASGYESDTVDGGHTNGHYADNGARYAPPQM